MTTNDVWNGYGNWTGNPTDWSLGSPPTAAESAEIQSGGDTLSTTAKVASILIDSGATLYIGQLGALTVTGGLTNNGALDVNSNGNDGAGKLTIGGTLTNTNTVNIGNGSLSAPITVTAAGLANTGTINLVGNGAVGTANQATLNIAGAAPAILTGTINIYGDALLEFGSGGLQTIAGGVGLLLDGAGARASIGAGATNSALATLQTNAGTLDLEGDWNVGPGGASVTTSAGLANIGTLRVDANGGAGDSSLTLGGALYNLGTTVIGNYALAVPTSVTATSLVDIGNFTLQGNDASYTRNQATLQITGAAPTALTGNLSLYGDADLTFASGGIQMIGPGAQLLMDGTESQISISGAGINSALSTLANNAGTLDLEGNWNVGPGGVTVTTSVGFTNTGTFRIDGDGGAGDSLLTIGGAFGNYGAATIGNTGLSVSTIVTASGYANSGTLNIEGSSTYLTTSQATLDITALSPAILTGAVNLYGDALLEFSTGNTNSAKSGDLRTNTTTTNGITSIGYNASLLLNGSQARISLGAGSTNSALGQLALNDGTFNMEGNWNAGPGGVTVTTSVGFTNVGTTYVDWNGGAGGSILAIGGTLSNAGFIDNTTATLDIGNGGLSAPTTVTATVLSTSGRINLYGNTALNSANQATLDIAGAAPTTVTGAWLVLGDADMEFGSGSVTTVGSGSSLEVDGAEAQISDSGGANNSALGKLAANYGTLTFRGNSGNGAGGGAIKTSVALVNTGTFDVDPYGGDGGTTVAIGGRLTNSGTLNIGNGSLSAATNVTATALTNNGSIYLAGNYYGNGEQAVLNIAGAAGFGATGVLTGYVQLSGYALLEFASGSINTIAAGATLYIETGQAPGGGFIADKGALSSNSALTGLSTNSGTLGLAYGAVITTTAGTGFTNTGTVNIDDFDGSDGGSGLNAGGALTNLGTLYLGSGGQSHLSVVTATALANYGAIYLAGDGTAAATMTIGGGAANYGAVNIGNDTTLSVGANTYVEDAGTTTITGLLIAQTVDAEGGLVNFTTALAGGDGTGALDIGGGGAMEFGGAVDTSHTVTFEAATGTLELGAPASFAGTIAGFSGNDVIDLLNAAETGLSYSGQTLTVSGSSGTLASLTFSGSYTTSSFAAVSDGHGGTDIILAPVVQWVGGNGNWSTNTNWSSAPTSKVDAVIAASGGYTVTISAAISVGSIDMTDPSAALAINAPGATDSVVGNLLNSGYVYVDTGGNQGGSKLKIGGAFVNTNQVTLGNSSLGAATTVTAASLFNSGTINLWGNEALAPSNQMTLDITGAAPTVLTGNLYIHGDTLVEFGSGGIATIAQGSELQLDGVNSRLSIGAGATNSALAALTTIAGIFDMEGDWNTGPGGSSVTTKVGMTNSGTLDLDVYGGDGASTLKVGGALDNAGAMTIGNSSLSASTTVTASSFVNSGSLNMWGNDALAPKYQATLNITGAAPTILTGKLYIHGDSLIEFGSGGITSIAAGAELQLDGVNSRLSIGAGATNSALNNLATVSGIFDMEGDWSTGPGGSSVTTTLGLTNTGTLDLDVYGGDGASSLAIGGGLNNSGSMTIGNNGLSADTTVSATGLTNNGTITLWGNQTLGTTNQATLDITGAGVGILSGSLYLHGDAVVEFGSGGITSIAAGVELQLDGAQSLITSGGVAGNSGLGKLTTNAGTFDMEGNWSTGPGGSAVTTTVGLTNTGTLALDVYGNDGASSLAIGGILTNRGVVNIGNSSLSADTTVSATSFTNYGSIDLQGNTASKATNQAILAIGAAAPAALTGTVYVRGDADLEFTKSSITSISAGAFLELDGAQAVVSDGAGTTNSALSGLATVTGRLLLRGDSGYGAGAESLKTTVALTVTGELDVDEYGGDGGSSLTIGAGLTNLGLFIVGNTGSSAATSVTATALTNQGSLLLYGDSANPSQMTISGGATNDGTVSIGGNSVLDVVGSHGYVQNAGTTTVAGTLETSAVYAYGGLVDFTTALAVANSPSYFYIYGGGVLEYDGAVDSSRKVTFEASTGDLRLGAPASFAGNIAGFSGSDVIDLVGATVTGLSYSGHTLTVLNGASTVASLTFVGTYTTASFTTVSDGHGGTDIVDPHSAPKSAARSSQLAQFIQAVTSLAPDYGAAGVSTPLLHVPAADSAHMLAASTHFAA